MTRAFLPTPASPLRQRMIDDMNVLGFKDKTQRGYVRVVSAFAAFLGRSPETATPEDVRRYQVQASKAGVPISAMNARVSALRFLFTKTLDRPDLARRLIRVSRPRSLPCVLSPDEVGTLLAATTCLKHRAALSIAYGAGLRVSEVAALKVGHIDSQRMVIRVEHGKGGRYRNAILSQDLL
ncbi:MAG: tyrosine-type recombinase/integrase, partial [Hyphomonadaceae bacterium]